MLSLLLFCSGLLAQTASVGPDPSQPVFLPPLGQWSSSTYVTLTQFSRKVELNGVHVADTQVDSTNFTFDTTYRYSRRMAIRLILDQQMSSNTDQSSTSAGELAGIVSSSTNSSGLREPILGLLFPFVLWRGRFIFDAQYSPSTGTKSDSNNLRGGRLIKTELRVQFKHQNIRPFFAFSYNDFGAQESDSSQAAGRNELHLGVGIYGYFDDVYSGQFRMDVYSVDSYLEEFEAETRENPSYTWRKLELTGYYRDDFDLSYFISYAFSNFPDLDYGSFKVTSNSGNALRIGLNYLF